MARGRTSTLNILLNMARGRLCSLNVQKLDQRSAMSYKSLWTWTEAWYVLNKSQYVLKHGQRSVMSSKCPILSYVQRLDMSSKCPWKIKTVEQNVQCCTLYQTLYILQVVGFDGSTTMDEFTISLTSLIGCRSPDLSGFAIFSDDPIEAGVDHSLAGSDKVKIY